MMFRRLSGCRTRPPDHRRLAVEALEDRTVPSGAGLVPSLVALGGATPRPIPLPASVLPVTGTAELSGPDVYLLYPGPATAPEPFGNEPNGITDFNGVYGGAAVLGSGNDGDADPRHSPDHCNHEKLLS